MPDLSWALHRKLLRMPEVGFNAEVYEHFKDSDEFESRKKLRDSLLIQAKDSRSTAAFKIQYFREFVQKVHDKPTIIGHIKHQYDEVVRYRCDCQLKFREHPASVPKGKTAIEADISFRLEDTNKTITETKINRLASRIRQVLVAGNKGYSFDKGKYLALYIDKEEGYDFQIYCVSPSEGEQVIKKIMSIQGHEFKDKLFRCSEPKRNSENNNGKQIILGEEVSIPRWRPNAKVHFVYADLVVHGLNAPINLVDVGKRRSRRRMKVVI